jgi:hypothetical protein
VLNATLTAFSIAWDPGLRGVLVVATGVTVLMGSIYLVLGTNLGSRLGFLVTVAGLTGWLTLMGFVWCMYGIGYKGTATHWKVEEVLTSSSAKDLSAAKLAAAHDLSKWTELPADSPARGEAAAAATAAVAPPAGVDSRVKLFTADTDFLVTDAYTKGGKKISHHGTWRHPFGDKGFGGFVASWLPGPHPPHYTIIQVQAVKKVEVPFGEAPPPAKVDPSAPVESVVLVRDLGKLRVPSFLIMCASGIVFGITCNTLHRRDKAMWAAHAAIAAPAEA